MSARVLNAVLVYGTSYNYLLLTLLAIDAVLPPDVKDDFDRTPVDLARERNYNEVVDYITNYKPLARGELIHMIAVHVKILIDL